MRYLLRAKFEFSFLLFLLTVTSIKAQLKANAGSGRVICPGESFSIGGNPSASGGTPPYNYSWSPLVGLTNTTTSNPVLNPTTDIIYTLKVTDDSGKVATSSVQFSMNYLQYVNAGTDTSICVGGTALIGGAKNITGNNISFSWIPVTGLSNNSLPQPIASPKITTTYTLTSTISGCKPKINEVTVIIIPTPSISAGTDITINEGETATLHASGGFLYNWSPINTLTYPKTQQPNAQPILTTDYFVIGADLSGNCKGIDTITVIVIPSDEPVIYNTFTPNSDNNNDTWYIGNIEKFPNNEVEIYNRYGKLVYKTKGYDNKLDGHNWDGKAFGNDVPSATYFYIINLGITGKNKYHGTVTIVR
jgi:gliding motility-associated-like protein